MLVALGAILLVGALARLPGIAEPPARYHPTRQYFSGLLARDLLVRVQPDAVPVPEAIAHETRHELIEPPLIEVASVAGFLLTGEQSWWLPRLLSLLCWTGAAAVAFFLGRRLAGPVAGLVAAAVLQLAPGTAEAARSFQPESLLLLLTASAALALVRLAEASDARRPVVVAGALVGLATAVKLTAGLFLLPLLATVALPLLRDPRSRRRGLLLPALAVVPSALWYGAGLWLVGFLQGQTGGRIVPGLWADRSYWTGWWEMATSVVPAWLLLVAAAGWLAAPPAPRRILASLALGYLLLGMAFTYHASTHSYYSLPVLLPVGLAAGVAVAAVLDRAPTELLRRSAGWSLGAGAALAALAVFGITRDAPPAGAQPHLLASIRAADLLPDDAVAAVVSPEYGSALRYYGGVRTTTWPSVWDLRYADLQGEPRVPASARLEALVREGATHLVVLDRLALDQQPDLAAAISGLTRLAEGTEWLLLELPPRR